jgi:hypothetical protein
MEYRLTQLSTLQALIPRAYNPHCKKNIHDNDSRVLVTGTSKAGRLTSSPSRQAGQFE